MVRWHFEKHDIGKRKVCLITTGMVALAAVYAATATTAVSMSASKDEKKRAEGQSKDQERLQQQIREEAEAAPGIAADKAREDLRRRRSTMAKQGKTILTAEGPEDASKSILGA